MLRSGIPRDSPVDVAAGLSQPIPRRGLSIFKIYLKFLSLKVLPFRFPVPEQRSSCDMASGTGQGRQKDENVRNEREHIREFRLNQPGCRGFETPGKSIGCRFNYRANYIVYLNDVHL